MELLKIAEATKSFAGQEVLRGVSLTVAEQHVTAIIGASGSGKSTLLRCINGLETLDAGTISLEGHPIPRRTADLRHWRERIGFVFQSFNLFPHLTALENVALPLRLVKGMTKEDSETRAAEFLERVGLAHRAKGYPDELSGGQQQRVAIARAIGLDPALMLFDEPTSALDPELTGEVMEVIAELAANGMTMIIVSHELRFVRRIADTVHFMTDGEILESGPPAELFNAPATEEARRFLRSLNE